MSDDPNDDQSAAIRATLIFVGLAIFAVIAFLAFSMKAH